VRHVQLSELFKDDKNQTFVYSLMFELGASGPLEIACPLCTSIVDGIDGALPRITRRIKFAVVTKAPIERLLARRAAGRLCCKRSGLLRRCLPGYASPRSSPASRLPDQPANEHTESTRG